MLPKGAQLPPEVPGLSPRLVLLDPTKSPKGFVAMLPAKRSRQGFISAEQLEVNPFLKASFLVESLKQRPMTRRARAQALAEIDSVVRSVSMEFANDLLRNLARASLVVDLEPEPLLERTAVLIQDPDQPFCDDHLRALELTRTALVARVLGLGWERFIELASRYKRKAVASGRPGDRIDRAISKVSECDTQALNALNEGDF